jgi:hypothetical protein
MRERRHGVPYLLPLLPMLPMADLGYINESLQGLYGGRHWKGTQVCGPRGTLSNNAGTLRTGTISLVRTPRSLKTSAPQSRGGRCQYKRFPEQQEYTGLASYVPHYHRNLLGGTLKVWSRCSRV